MFYQVLMETVARDCNSMADPENQNALFGEFLAVNIVFNDIYNPFAGPVFRMGLAEYLRSCRRYIKETQDHQKSRQIYKSMVSVIRKSYKDKKAELYNVQNLVGQG